MNEYEEKNVLTDGAFENIACMIMVTPTEYRELIENSLRLKIIIENAKSSRYFGREDVLVLAGEEVPKDE